MRTVKYTLLILSLFVFTGICFANVLPMSVSDIPKESIGLYQTDKIITVYSEPDESSAVLYRREVNYSDFTDVDEDGFFAILLPKKELGYAYITDVADDENWVQIVYNKDRNLKGWIYKNDDFQFLPWGIFFDMYGRKYGIYQLKNPPADYNEIFSQPNPSGQLMGQISRPKFIRMTSIEGTWMLVTVLNPYDSTTTGYIQWRTGDGEILLFPAIKD